MAVARCVAKDEKITPNGIDAHLEEARWISGIAKNVGCPELR